MSEETGKSIANILRKGYDEDRVTAHLADKLGYYVAGKTRTVEL